MDSLTTLLSLVHSAPETGGPIASEEYRVLLDGVCLGRCARARQCDHPREKRDVGGTKIPHFLEYSRERRGNWPRELA